MGVSISGCTTEAKLFFKYYKLLNYTATSTVPLVRLHTEEANVELHIFHLTGAAFACSINGSYMKYVATFTSSVCNLVTVGFSMLPPHPKAFVRKLRFEITAIKQL